MTQGARQLHYSYAEYLALEQTSLTRHEYLHGEIYATAGGSPEHAALAASLIAALHRQLREGCRPFSSDLRVYIAATELTTYPDVSVVCGKSERAAKDPLAVTNPVVLAEVTSPSTEDYDRGEKLRHYQTLSSLREMVLISHGEPRITVHRREGGRWTTTEARAGEAAQLSSVGVELDVDDLYRNVLLEL